MLQLHSVFSQSLFLVNLHNDILGTIGKLVKLFKLIKVTALAIVLR